jgi:hypothetical protein
MIFLYYWLVSVLVALLAILERWLNGYSGMFWTMIGFSTLFLLAALGSTYKEEDR